jgi:mono/diheme cytochrome c family protein
VLAALVALGVLWLTGRFGAPQQPSQAPQAPSKPLPEVFAAGESQYNSHCAPCHGPAATGSAQGPSFLSQIYAPNHHSDASFFLAVKQGVRAHHWQFGDMPALPEVTPEHVGEIILYVRWLQQQAGIR